MLELIFAALLAQVPHSVTLSWQQNGTPQSNNIYVAPAACPANQTPDGSFTLLATVPATQNYTHQAVPVGRYCYYVTALDASNNESGPSNLADAVVTPAAPVVLPPTVE